MIQLKCAIALFPLVVSVAITGNCLPLLAEVSLQASSRTDNQSAPFLQWGTLCPLLTRATVNCACHDDAATDAGRCYGDVKCKRYKMAVVVETS